MKEITQTPPQMETYQFHFTVLHYDSECGPSDDLILGELKLLVDESPELVLQRLNHIDGEVVEE